MAASTVFGRTPSGTITVASEALEAYRRLATKCGICGLEIRGPEVLWFPNHRVHDEGGCLEQHTGDCPACGKNGLGNGVTAFCLHYKRVDGSDDYKWLTEAEVGMALAKRQALSPKTIDSGAAKTSAITDSADKARQHFQSSRAILPLATETIEQCTRALGIVERIRKITAGSAAQGTNGKIDDVELRMAAKELAALFSSMAADKEMNREQVLDAFADAGNAISTIRASRK